MVHHHRLAKTSHAKSSGLHPVNISVFCLWTIFLLALTTHLPLSLGDKIQQKFVTEPDDVSVLRGTNSVVYLPCIVQDKVGDVQWTRNSFALGIDRELPNYPRYKMIGSDDTGNYTLRISPVELEDDGTYICLMTAGERAEPAKSRSAKVVVLVPPEPPVIVQGPALQTTAGMQLELQCESGNGKPAAQLEWLNAKGEKISGATERIEDVPGSPKLKNARSVLALNPTKDHNGQTLTCRAKSPALPTPLKATILLEVKYPPDVSLTLNNPRIIEFDSVTFTCTAKANPPNVVYSWYKDKVVIPGNHSTTMTLTKVTREFHGSVIVCEVSNAAGKARASISLDISFGPKFKVAPTPVAADKNADVTLHCHVEGNPTPNIVWTFEKSNSVIGSGSLLNLQCMSVEKAGRYQCRATVPGFPEIHSYHTVLMKGPPNIRSPEIQYGIEGDELHVECNVRSVPAPIRVRWYQDGKEVDSDGNARYSSVHDPLDDGVKYTLKVYSSTEADFGAYNCTVTNSFGIDSLEITLKKQKVVPLMIILAGVIGGIAVVVAFTIVIVLWLRRYRKSTEDEEREPEKESKTSDRSSNDSDLKVEIRTSSSLSNNDSEPWEEGSVDPRRGSSSQDYRYSADYAEPAFPPKVESHNNNGYIPYVDYQRDYNPPPLNETRNSFYGGIARVDPRYQAGYANPYLRSPTSTLPPPQAYANGPAPAASPAGTTQAAVGSPKAESPQGQYITTQIPLKPGTLATHV